MATVIEEPRFDVQNSQATHGPDESLLTDKVPEHLRAPRAFAGMTLALGLVFVIFCTRPIWHTDIWGHLSYGRYLCETRSLPTTEPLLPLAKGMPFVDSAWLSQVIGYWIASHPRLQIAGLQGVFALTVTLCGAMISWQVYRRTWNGWFSLLSLCTFLFVASIPLTILRPQLVGVTCYVFLLTRLCQRDHKSSDWFVYPLTFIVWANCHASFMVGLGLIGCFWVGRMFDVFARTKSVSLAIKDARAVRLLLLLELSAAAVLVNPYSIRLYAEALSFSGNENLQDLSEWQPVTLRDGQGQVFIVTAIALAMLYRLSPRRVRSWEVMSLLLFGLATLWSSRMIVWWAPIAAILVSQHAYAVWRNWSRASFADSPYQRTGKWSFVMLGIVWICFMISPLAIALRHGKQPDPSRALSKFTPRFAAEYLNEHPPQGLVFNTYEWGDFLQWAGPRDMQLFVNSHAHLIPRDVWMAYMQIIEQRGGWEETLDRYGVNAIVLDLEHREQLIKKLRDDERWQSPAERDGQVIFFRKKPILPGGPSQTALPEEKPVNETSSTHG